MKCVDAAVETDMEGAYSLGLRMQLEPPLMKMDLSPQGSPDSYATLVAQPAPMQPPSHGRANQGMSVQ